MCICRKKKTEYVLTQSGLLVQQFLEEGLSKHGYVQRKLTPGLWKHIWRPIFFIKEEDAR